MSLLVVSCLKSQLADDFANALDVPLIQVSYGLFADTEVYVDVKESELISGSEILFVHQFFLSDPRCNGSINDQLTNLLIACDLLRNIGARKITTILPYLAYSRQDESFGGKFAGPVKLMGRFLKAAGIDSVFACDLHSEKLFDLFQIQLEEISLVDFWAEQLRSLFKEEIDKNLVCIASPDIGGLNRANRIAQILNVPVVYLEKKRINPDNPVALCLHGDVNSKTVIIVDDIIDTGRTAIQASLMLKMHGATKIIGVFTHAVFSPGIIDRLTKSDFYKIYITNSLLNSFEKPHKKISVCSINKYLIQKISEKLS
ncbi:MAG: ribose-phosphate diphosphokinase [bacterium]